MQAPLSTQEKVGLADQDTTTRGERRGKTSAIIQATTALLLIGGLWSLRSRSNTPPQHEDADNSDTFEQGRGRYADAPSEIPVKGWKDIFWRVKSEISDDRVGLVSAGTTFYLLLALFPALGAFVSIYGLVLDPATLQDHVASLSGVLPAEALQIVKEQLDRLLEQDESSLSLGFVFGLALALWSANSGIKSLFEAMNVAYDEIENRGFIKLNAISLCFTVGAILLVVVLLTAVAVIPAVLERFYLGEVAETALSLARWPVLFLVVLAGVVLIHRFGPSRANAKWRWVVGGSVLTAFLWVAASVLFSWYLANFGNYNETYGSLGAVIGLMMWTWISIQLLVIGAEFNAEMEHQTARDSTTGPPEPMGQRGATMADSVGPAAG
ncbi:MAG: YihY/virulence factor BrkB family protein [Rhizobiales bacterium]|nr:YihY/virulence factor BrkB family protein [Hyphomicrobiales bacterium]